MLCPQDSMSPKDRLLKWMIQNHKSDLLDILRNCSFPFAVDGIQQHRLRENYYQLDSTTPRDTTKNYSC